MPNTLEIFVFTNGASTFEYTMKSLENQTVKVPIRIIRNFTLLEGCKECLKLCKSDYFIKVDDDMLLHPDAIGFYRSVLNGFQAIPRFEIDRVFRRNVSKVETVFFAAYLYDVQTEDTIQSLKMYNCRLAKKVGFRKNTVGKVDGSFMKDIKRGIDLIYKIDSKSIVAIHACRSLQDFWKYTKLWNDQSDNTVKHKPFPRSFSIENQYGLFEKIEHMNRMSCSSFDKYLRDNGLYKFLKVTKDD